MSCYLRALEAGHRVEGECGVAVVAPRGVELGRQHRRERRLLQYEGYALDNLLSKGLFRDRLGIC